MIPEYTTYIIHILFFGINLYILWIDSIKRKIPNNLLIWVLLILPIWLYTEPTLSQKYLAPQYIFFIFFIVLGIFSYKENTFLWSGDIKYFSLLILFLWEKSIISFIGNIGILTFITLGLILSILIGEILALKDNNLKKLHNITSINIKKNVRALLVFLFDWIFIGLFIVFLSKLIIGELLQRNFIDWELYLLISIGVFLLRSKFHFFIMNWEHRIFPIFGIFIFFWYFFQKNGPETFFIETFYYIKNIWPYAIAFGLTYSITNWIFSCHDKVVQKTWIKNTFETIPYSIIIFIGYILLYFFDIQLTTFL